MQTTLDQQRAALAWGYAKEGIQRFSDEYKNLAKGAPALIMNSGLMATLAFYKSKKGAADLLLDHLIRGLVQRCYKKIVPTGEGTVVFEKFMEGLQASTSTDYMRMTDEVLELLKWIRHFVTAVDNRSES